MLQVNDCHVLVGVCFTLRVLLALKLRLRYHTDQHPFFIEAIDYQSELFFELIKESKHAAGTLDSNS
jgi:hypothetical protein